jgi:hypothetical protein
VVSDAAAVSSVMKDGVKKEGMMQVGVSRKPYLVVISDGTLSWYESKKSLEATNSVALGDTVCDSFGDLLFVQSGDTVYDFQCKSEKEVASWLEALRAAAQQAATIDQRQPLARYKLRTVFPVRLMLALPGGTVRVVCNTKHTPDQAKTQLFDVARQRGLLETAGQFCAPEYYFLKYAGFDRILIDEYRPFAELPYINLLRDSFAGIFLVAVSKPELVDSGIDLRALLKTDGVMPSALAVDGVDEVERERSIQSLIHESLWHSLAARCDDGDAEINVVRCRMARFRMRAFAEIRDRLPEFINSVPRPVPCPATVQVTCHLPEVRGLKTVAIDVQMRPSHIRDMMFGKMSQAAGTSFGKRAADFVLKVLGYRSYFVSEAPFIDFDYVRSCIHRGRRIELSLVEFDQRQALQNEPLSVVDAGLSANLQWIGVAERCAPRADDRPQSAASPRGEARPRQRGRERAAEPLGRPARRSAALDAAGGAVHDARAARLGLPACRPTARGRRRCTCLSSARSTLAARCCARRSAPCRSRSSVPTGSATFDGTAARVPGGADEMPKGARACLTVYACPSGSRDTNVAKAVPLAWLGVQCFDWNDRLVQGRPPVPPVGGRRRPDRHVHRELHRQAPDARRVRLSALREDAGLLATDRRAARRPRARRASS